MAGNLRTRLAEAILSPRFFQAVVAAALLTRVVWAVSAGDAQRFYDADSYITIADNVLAGEGFVWGDQLVGRPPLYPLLVAATRVELFGREFLALYLAQALLSTATVVLFAAGARRLLGPMAAAAAFFIAFDPFLIYHVGAVLTETLFTFFLAALFYAVTLAAAPREGAGGLTWGAAALAAAAGGLAAGGSLLTRPSLMWLAVAFAAFVAVSARPRARAAVAAAGMLALCALVVLPWAARNHRVTGRWIFTTLGVGASLYDGLGPQADGSSDMNFLHAMPELKSMTEYERDRHLRDLALAEAARDPWRAARLAVVKVGRFWSPVPNSPLFAAPQYQAASALAVLPVYALAIGALATGAVRGRVLSLLLAAPVYFTLIHAVFVGSARYRAPVMPFVAIIAAAAVAAFLARGLGLLDAEPRTGARRRQSHAPDLDPDHPK